ncbi:MAG: hypothetical protein MJZ96_08270 [Paludibacteraceae bacterium]|nr:hypothetical protein [Paludibacteraceae bacterium]
MTYSKVSVFVLLAVIAASLAACSNIEPTIDDYDMYVMVHEIDEETQIPVAKIYKNKTLLFEGEHDKNITYSNFEVENGHLYFLKATYDEATRKYNRQMYKDFELFSTSIFPDKSVGAQLSILGFYNEHYIYCYHDPNAAGYYYRYFTDEQITIHQYGQDDSEFCILENPQPLIKKFYVSKFYHDNINEDNYFAGMVTVSSTDINSETGLYLDAYWKNNEEFVMPNNYYDRPDVEFPIATELVEGMTLHNNKPVFGGLGGAYWYDGHRYFLQYPEEFIKSIVSYKGSIYILSTYRIVTYDDAPDNFRNTYEYHKNAYIYKDGELIYENDEVRNPRDLYVINGDCYYSAVEMDKYYKPFSIWKNLEKITEYGEVRTEVDWINGGQNPNLREFTNHFYLVKK